MQSEIELNDICTPTQFAEEHPNIFEGKGAPSMEYLLRTRHLNGLSEAGAVIEPAQRRPLIVKSKFAHWLLNRATAK